MLTETTGPPLAPAGWGGQESPGHMQAAGSGGHTGRISVAEFPWRFGVDGEAEKGACSSLESRQWQGLGWRLEPGVPLAWGGERGRGGGVWPCRPWSGRACPAVKRCPASSLRPSLQKRCDGRFQGPSPESFGCTFSSNTGWRTRKAVPILHIWKCIKPGT